MDEDSARIVGSLLEIILKEIGHIRRRSYGYSAEQLVDKVVRDASSKGILRRLVKDVNPREIEKLMLKVIPNRYAFEIEVSETEYEPDAPHVMPMLTELFRAAYECSCDRTQAMFVQEFVRVIKEGSEDTVRTYCQEFFSMDGMKHLEDDDVQLMKEHYLDQLKSRRASEKWIISLVGIGKYLAEEEAIEFISALLKLSLGGGERIDRDVVAEAIWDIYWGLEETIKSRIDAHLDSEIAYYSHMEEGDKIGVIKAIKTRIAFPF